MNALMFLIPALCALCVGIWGLFYWLAKEIGEENDFRDYESGEVKRGRKK